MILHHLLLGSDQAKSEGNLGTTSIGRKVADFFNLSNHGQGREHQKNAHLFLKGLIHCR